MSSSTDSDSGTAPGKAARLGAPWNDSDHRTLIDGVRAGLLTDEIASELGRTPQAIHSRARKMISADEHRVPGERGIDQLRRLMAEQPDYDWEGNLGATVAGAGSHYWSDEDLDTLRQAWRNATPLPTLSRTLDCPETRVVRQLRITGIATSAGEVVERLGCTPGGTVELRHRLATDREATEVWVLIMSVLGGEHSYHVSIHSAQGDAERTRDEKLGAMTAADTKDAASLTAGWHICKRWPGGGDSGDVLAGTQTIET